MGTSNCIFFFFSIRIYFTFSISIYRDSSFCIFYQGVSGQGLGCVVVYLLYTLASKEKLAGCKKLPPGTILPGDGTFSFYTLAGAGLLTDLFQDLSVLPRTLGFLHLFP